MGTTQATQQAASQPQTTPKRTRANGKGKGNGDGAKTKIKGKRYSKKDFVELSILSTYIVQQRGNATLHDILGVFKDELGSTVNDKTLSSVLEALKKKDFLAANYVLGIRTFSIKKVQFNCAVEIPHVSAMLPTVFEDPAAVAIKAEIEAHIGIKETKDQKLPEEWADYTATFRLTEPLYGGQVLAGNPQLAFDYENSKYNDTIPKNCDPNDIPLLFERGPSGELKIHKACVKGFFKQHLRSVGISPWAADNIYPKAILATPKRVFIAEHPIQRAGMDAKRGGKGAGFGYYETIPAGEILTLRFAAPTKNFVSPLRMERWLGRILSQPTRSFSPARGTQTGAAELLTFECSLWSDQDKDLDELEKAAEKKGKEDGSGNGNGETK